MTTTLPRFLLIGQLTRDYILLPSGEALIDVPGGNALYASVGLMVWEPEPAPAIIARVGEDYPHEWLAEFQKWGLDTSGVKVLSEVVDLRSFSAFVDRITRIHDDPVAHFARLGIPFPKSLFGYRNTSANINSRTRLQNISLRQGDIPISFLDANVAHFCPVDYLTHSLLPAVLRQAQFTTVTLDPAPGYMTPAFWDDMPSLLNGLTAFMPAEEDVRALFHGRTDDLWEMAEALANFGCEIIIIKRGERGQILYIANSHSRWDIPPYPARMKNPLGAGDAFCGGFLAGYRRTFDPLEATLYGNISSSLVIEGDTADYALDALPGLAQARMDSLRQSARKL